MCYLPRHRSWLGSTLKYREHLCTTLHASQGFCIVVGTDIPSIHTQVRSPSFILLYFVHAIANNPSSSQTASLVAFVSVCMIYVALACISLLRHNLNHDELCEKKFNSCCLLFLLLQHCSTTTTNNKIK